MKIWPSITLLIYLSACAMQNTVLTPRQQQAKEKMRLYIHVLIKQYLIKNISTNVIKTYFARQSPDLFTTKTVINTQNGNGITLLHAAVLNTDYNFTGWLIHRGAHINIQTNQGDTALHIATRKANAPIVEWLLKHNADTTIQNNHGETPKMIINRLKINESEIPNLFNIQERYQQDNGQYDSIELLLTQIEQKKPRHDDMCTCAIL